MKKKGKMETKRKLTTDIPIKVLVDILSRLPAKFVWSLRSICKHWLSLIEAPSFADLHLRRSKEICFMFWGQHKVSDKTRFYSIDKDGKAVRVVQEQFVHPTMKTISSTNGLICHMETDGRINVCNPVTHELITLPKPTFFLSPYFEYNYYIHVIDIGIGFDSITKRYKVMAIMAISNRKELPKVEIFTLGESKGWREVQVPSSVQLYDWHQRLYANGCMYWKTSEFYNRHTDVDGDMTRALISFNFAEERFEFVSLPSDIDTRNNSYGMLEVGGCLCLQEGKNGKIRLRTLANSGTQAWVDQHIVLPPSFANVYPISSGVMLTESYTKTTPHKKRHICYYNEQGQTLKTIKVQGIPNSLEISQLHTESVVSLKSLLATAES